MYKNVFIFVFPFENLVFETQYIHYENSIMSQNFLSQEYNFF